MEEFNSLVSRVPENWYEIKDCWMVACKMVTMQLGRQDKYLDLNAYFYYNRSNEVRFPEGFEGIIRRNISVAEDREKTKEVEMEYDFLRQFVGLSCKGKACTRKEAYEYVRERFDADTGCIMWIDTFYAEWNEMCQQVHFPHCVTVFRVKPDKCVIFDAFRKENPCFEVETDRLFAMTYYVNIFKGDEKYAGFKNDDEALNIFFKNFILKNKSIEDYIDALRCVESDLEKTKPNLNKELNNENTIKLMMRIFVNQYQKGCAQLRFFKQTRKMPDEMIGTCEDINGLWKLCSGVFAKICYLSNEKKKTKYDLLCNSVNEIRNKLVNFDEMINRKVKFG